MMRTAITTLVVGMTALALVAAQRLPDKADTQRIAELVAAIQRADYEGNLPALARLRSEVPITVNDAHVASRLRYWRGFALWRRAINGFNDSVDPRALEQDAQEAIKEFDESLKLEPGFADASVGKLSCLGIVAFLNPSNKARLQELLAQLVPLLNDTMAAAPENPRLLWARGPSDWSRPGMSPSQIEEREAAAIASYERGLKLARAQKGKAHDPLEPAWGEAELLMSLAWSQLNRATPDVGAAETYAKESLALVPYWHYVRDILMPQIQRAKQK